MEQLLVPSGRRKGESTNLGTSLGRQKVKERRNTELPCYQRDGVL